MEEYVDVEILPMIIINKKHTFSTEGYMPTFSSMTSLIFFLPHF